MNTEIGSAPFHTDSAAASGHLRWQAASLTWIVAGFLYPLLAPATVSLVTSLQNLLVSTAGFSDVLLAQRVAFTVLRVPLAALF